MPAAPVSSAATVAKRRPYGLPRECLHVARGQLNLHPDQLGQGADETRRSVQHCVSLALGQRETRCVDKLDGYKVNGAPGKNARTDFANVVPEARFQTNDVGARGRTRHCHTSEGRAANYAVECGTTAVIHEASQAEVVASRTAKRWRGVW